MERAELAPCLFVCGHFSGPPCPSQLDHRLLDMLTGPHLDWLLLRSNNQLEEYIRGDLGKSLWPHKPEIGNHQGPCMKGTMATRLSPPAKRLWRPSVQVNSISFRSQRPFRVVTGGEDLMASWAGFGPADVLGPDGSSWPLFKNRPQGVVQFNWRRSHISRPFWRD